MNTPMTDALNECHSKEWNSSGRSIGEQYAEMRDHASKLEEALQVAEKALQVIAKPALGGKMQQYSAQEALRAIEQLRGE